MPAPIPIFFFQFVLAAGGTFQKGWVRHLLEKVKTLFAGTAFVFISRHMSRENPLFNYFIIG